ncbi:MAG TPA: hypothetical protein DCL77_11425 [Prolixibacteraceae bacterium]|jgi:hypothetical protein|nr:hypothetical protein [Prolixibacteraceae bacterium]
MYLKNIFSGLLILISVSIFAENNSFTPGKDRNLPTTDSVQLGIDYLKKYIQPKEVWQSDNPEIMNLVKGLIHFAEDEHIDSVLVKLNRFHQQKDARYINRSPKFVSDSLQVHGYIAYPMILEKMKQLDREIWNGVNMNSIPLSKSMQARIDNQPKPIAPADEKSILKLTGLVLPDSLINVIAPPDSTSKKANNFNQIKQRYELRKRLLEEARVDYNRKIQRLAEAELIAYKNHAVKVFSDSLQNNLHDSLTFHNQQVLTHYNDSIVQLVNATFNQFVLTLERYAQNDSVGIWIHSLTGKPTQVWLRNNQKDINRLYIKNEQNDSLAIRVMNLDKHSLGIAIDDDVTFSRMVEKQHRDYVFQKFQPDKKLTTIQKKYEIITPWEYGGNGTFGLTQTYLNNWKGGGESAFSFLMVLKGYANYSAKKLRWENSGEVRNGWIRQGGEIDQTQKNDDKLELISRLGVNAFDHWFYSTEIDFLTQFFNGYNYPDKTNPISSYLSPAKTLIKVGLDYKPNKNFSLFLSPLTSKTVYVRDTAHIDQTRYGISPNRQTLWEPGLNTDVRYKIDITPQISYETKYKMFINYQNPFKKLDITWENLVVAQLTNRISMNFMIYFLYDDNVTFPTGKFDLENKEIYKPKLQTKELMTIGFSYKINKHIFKRRKIGG